MRRLEHLAVLLWAMVAALAVSAQTPRAQDPNRQAALAVAWEIKQRDGWFPDAWHVNDWHTGLIPFLLAQSQNDPNWASLRGDPRFVELMEKINHG